MENCTTLGIIDIYADGACRGNQNTHNIGAWAYKIILGNRFKMNGGLYVNTTNNKMELQAAIEALKALKPTAANYQINIYSDSQYVVDGMNLWIQNWIIQGFSNVKNADLWQELLQLTRKFPCIQYKKVKGHANISGNIAVDTLCNQIMDQYMKENTENPVYK